MTFNAKPFLHMTFALADTFLLSSSDKWSSLQTESSGGQPAVAPSRTPT